MVDKCNDFYLSEGNFKIIFPFQIGIKWLGEVSLFLIILLIWRCLKFLFEMGSGFILGNLFVPKLILIEGKCTKRITMFS